MIAASNTCLSKFLGSLESPPPRSIRDFANNEVVLSRGKFRGHPFRTDRFPASAIWFDLIDAHEFLYYVATGPTQSGKSLCCFIIPIMWCLFEKREDVIVGVPHLDMSNDKWKKDIKPAIEKSRYQELLPTTGEGSKGGKVRVLSFKNGAHLTFMSFGGDDKSKAGETAPNLIITETDGANEAQTTSQEATPIDQLCARTGSYDKDALIIMECTVSTTIGQTWTRYSAGTASKLIRPCPKCGKWVSPERKDFKGWEQAEDEIEAGKNAHFHCPACNKPWTDQERFKANEATRIVHRGQEVTPKGKVVGTPEPTRTCGFRWSAVDNMFRSSDLLGSMEWNCRRDRKQENAQKAMDQFQYAIPWEPPEDDEESGLDPFALATRIGGTQRKIIPRDHDVVVTGVDVRGKMIHYVTTSWDYEGNSLVADYGVVRVFSKDRAIETALLDALRYLRDKVLTYRDNDGEIRSAYKDEDGDEVPVMTIWLDAGWQTPLIYAFIDECNSTEYWCDFFRPSLGRGQSIRQATGAGGGYSHKEKVTTKIPRVGEEYYFSLMQERDPPIAVCLMNADHWKTFAHARLSTQIGERGAMQLFIPDSPEGHDEFCRHLAAEKAIRQFVPEKGEVLKWIQESRANHYLDCTYQSCVAAHYLGVRVAPPDIDTDLPEVDEDDYDEGDGDDALMMPDGRMF